MSKLPGVIILLGERNESNGELSSIALERARACFEIYSSRPSLKILVAGGYGNLASAAFRPHAYRLMEFLVELGVPKDTFLDPALGRNTLENALLARDIVGTFDTDLLYIVTSDFHRRRAQYIFEQLFENFQIKFHTSHTALPVTHLQALEEHESSEWEKMLTA
ncbi:MAG: YdcF family protein [Proteobacteria bacterium]|nr:YdcF family protein [Pseudomonadota bacterium]